MKNKPVQDKLSLMNDLLLELMPEELESRLELHVLVDPLSMLELSTDNNNNNNNNNND
ncbi:MAG: hypothetical protein LC803_22275 [Acidobacteria bacterium]|nr:hypothetical protein [Acidobacteriota bacterium]